MEEFFEPERQAFADWIYAQWGIVVQSHDPEADVTGSPERTVSRAVFTDQRGERYLIEKFDPGRKPVRQTVAEAVNFLERKGLDQALGYAVTREGEFLPVYGGGCFQLSRYLDNSGIQRPEYLESSRIGKNFARFLIRLGNAASGIRQVVRLSEFSIDRYIYQLFQRMKIHDPEVCSRFVPVLEFLEKRLMPELDSLPQDFSHGDLHPLNVIWNGEEIRAVIDWEFTGIKPQIYDLANLVGCAGIEDPNGLGMGMVMTVIQTVREAGIYHDAGWAVFPEYMIALRFAWLSEWLRNKDREMIEMEHTYLNLLVDNIDIIKTGWSLK